MSKQISSLQKLSGLCAALLLATLLIMPLLAGVGKVLSGEELLIEKRAVTALLKDRIESDKSALRDHKEVFARLQRPLNSDIVAEEIIETCQEAAANFSALAINQSCAASQSQLGGGLTQHTAQFTVTGPRETLLQALDSVSTEAELDILRLAADPDVPETTILSLRFSDVSKAPAREEMQE